MDGRRIGGHLQPFSACALSAVDLASSVDQEASVASDYRFSPACQFSTTVTGADVDAATSLTVFTRNRPSALTS